VAVEGVDAYPLYWPLDWKRTDDWRRSSSKYSRTFIQTRDGILKRLKLMGVSKEDMLISSNIPLRRDGLPLANMAQPRDTGVAVYWVERKYQNGKQSIVPRVMACDRWKKVEENMRAIEVSLESMHAMERAGASQVLERAFQGFTALPADTGHAAKADRPWREVLGMHSITRPTREAVDHAYRVRAAAVHPDRGGTHEQMVECNRARAEAHLEVRS
jgi:hypothetical protein